MHTNALGLLEKHPPKPVIPLFGMTSKPVTDFSLFSKNNR